MLTEIPFYVVMFGPIILLIVAAMAWVSLIGNVLAKPKPPAHVDTLEEIAERKARVFKMLAETEKSRLAAHHH
jgi:hypothetical protein